jgi:hypothetical protein
MMELLLNLVWLSMAAPAIWLWRKQRNPGHSLGPSHAGLVLICVLVLLFPAISVSDDLQYMRVEIEESAPSQRLVRLFAPDSGSPALHGSGDWVASVTPFFSFLPCPAVAGLALLQTVVPLNHERAHAVLPRGPPAPYLA